MPVLVGSMGFPMAAVREAVKRAAARNILNVLPKRGVIVMRADNATTRECLDLRTMLDQEGARRLIQAGADISGGLRAHHEAILEQVRA